MDTFPSNTASFNLFIILMLLAGISTFYKFNLHSSLIRYLDNQILFSIFKAVTIYSIISFLISSMLIPSIVPRSVALINWALVLIFSTAARFFIGFLLNFFSGEKRRKRILIYGTNQSSIEMLSALKNLNNYQIIGLIDDNIELIGARIRGIKVFSINKIEGLVENSKVEEILVSSKGITSEKKLTLLDKLDKFPIGVKLVPSFQEFVAGGIFSDNIKNIDVHDLLGRKIVRPDTNLLKKNIHNKVVCITGGGGSIGSELCRQVIKHKPKLLLIVDISELAIYEIDKELKALNGTNIDYKPILGDSGDIGFMSSLLEKYHISTIYHTAAYKHVPMVENNISQGVKNNFIGTINLALLCIKQNLETFVFISTDKAVRPTNVMGATKRLSEIAIMSLAKEAKSTNFAIVRFGNVLNSSGSVIPLFKEQINSGGPVTVTDKDVIRYFMTISEAVELVIQAGAMTKCNDLFILDMGEPVRIDDLAKKMIKLSGHTLKSHINPSGDIEIKYTGLRTGEKLYEELLIEDNSAETEHPLIFKASESLHNIFDVREMISQLNELVKDNDEELLLSKLQEFVPEYKPNRF